MVVTIEELIELANLGRRFVQEKHDQGITYWIGYLPTSNDLDEVQEELGRVIKPGCW